MPVKVLTVSIAAYNVEPYINQCLKSIVECDLIDKIEVFVIDDGATDNTLCEAEKYRVKYPNSVFLIHKTNEGYGSVFNYAIKHAAGKYFKLLDGDDWFDTCNLSLLIQKLEMENADVIVTNVMKGSAIDNLMLLDYCSNSHGAVKSGELSSIVGHWGLTYKTDILRASGLMLPKHCLYTDKLYSTIPFAKVKTVYAYPISLYCYRVGRDGQSISRKSRIIHIDDYLKVCEMLFNFYCKSDISDDSYINMRIINSYRLAIRALLLMDINDINLAKLKEFEFKNSKEFRQVYQKAARLDAKMGIAIWLMRLTSYYSYWLFKFVPKKLIDF